MHGRLLASRLDEKIAGPLADFGGGCPGPVGEPIPDPLAGDHFFDQGHQGFRIPPLQLQTARIFPGKDAIFVAFHRERNRCACGDGIHAGPVEQLVEIKDAVQILVHAQAAQRQNAFVFGLVGAGMLSLFGADPAASQRAGIAMIFDDLPFLDEVGVDLSGLLQREIAIGSAPVFQRRIAHFDGCLVHAVGAPLPEDGAVQKAVLGENHRRQAQQCADTGKHGPRHQRKGKTDPLGAVPAQALHLRRIVGADAPNAVENHRLQFFGPHDGAETRTGGNSAPVIAYARNEGQFFARRTDDGHSRPPAMLFFEALLRLDSVPTPQA